MHVRSLAHQTILDSIRTTSPSAEVLLVPSSVLDTMVSAANRELWQEIADKPEGFAAAATERETRADDTANVAAGGMTDGHDKVEMGGQMGPR